MNGLNQHFGGFVTPQEEGYQSRSRWDFPVGRAAVRFRIATTTRSVTEEKMLPERQVLFNQNTGEAVGIVSDRYKVRTHKEIVEAFDQVFGDAGLNFERRIRMSNDGGRLMAQYRFPEVTASVRQDDDVAMSLYAGNSYDLTRSVLLSLGAFRMICSNGMYIGVKLAVLRAIHTVKNLNLKAASSEFLQGIEMFKDQAGVWRCLAGTPLTVPDAAETLTRMRDAKRALPSEKYTDGALAMYKSAPEKTVWDFYNCLTQVASHDVRGFQAGLTMLSHANEIAREAYEVATGNKLVTV